MTIEELAREYEAQYTALAAKADALTMLLDFYQGKRLYELRKKIKMYNDMACECRYTASLLLKYYGEDAA